MKLVLDPHTHSIASVHAYSTIAENARYSADIGLELIGITDHAPAMPGVNTGRYFFNLRAVPDFLFGVEIMCGAEFNILNFEGEMDIPQEHKETYDIGIASLHRPCIAPGSVEENTAALVNAMKNPHVNIIGHPGEPLYPIDLREVVSSAIREKCVLEINEASLIPGGFRAGGEETIANILKLCKAENYPVVLGSDAHFFTHIGNFENSLRMLEELEFPEELVMNTSVEFFKEILWRKRK